jgi:hypothetical protein
MTTANDETRQGYIGVLDLLANPPAWSPEGMRLEHDRRLAADLAALGPRPRWWRRGARRRYDREVSYLRRAHAHDLHIMLTAPDPQHRAIQALMIGWELPT